MINADNHITDAITVQVSYAGRRKSAHPRQGRRPGLPMCRAMSQQNYGDDRQSEKLQFPNPVEPEKQMAHAMKRSDIPHLHILWLWPLLRKILRMNTEDKLYFPAAATARVNLF